LAGLGSQQVQFLGLRTNTPPNVLLKLTSG
jgi:hypothetical protein